MASLDHLGIGEHPVFTALAGESDSENERHLIARIAFCYALLRDPRVAAVFRRWDTDTGIGGALAALVPLLDQLAATLGLESRRALRDTDLDAACDRAGVDDDVYAQLVDAFQRLDDGINSDQRPDIIVFVRETLGLRWPWVVGELEAAYVRALFGRLWGERYIIDVPVEPTDTAAPPGRFEFEPQPGETAAAALARLGQAAAAYHDYLARAAQPPRQHRKPTHAKGSDIPTPTRYALWFYAVHVVGVSKEALARLYGVRPGTIRYGVKEGERLLGLVCYVWDAPDTDGPDIPAK